MNTSRKELKRIARENLTGNYSVPMGVFVTANLILAAVELPFSKLNTPYATVSQLVMFYVAEFLLSLVAIVFSAGQLRVHLKMARGQQYETRDLFYYFKQQPDRYLVAAFFMMLVTLFCGLPAYIGIRLLNVNQQPETILFAVVLAIMSAALEIYVTLKLEFLYLILMEHETMSVLDAYKVAMGLMKGQMLRLFLIYLSFLGMGILSVLSFGIGLLWVAPYQMQTGVLFYLDVVGELPNSQYTKEMNP